MFDVNPSEYRERRPKHGHEKQERVSYVARQVGHKTDDEGAYERRRLLCPPESTKRFTFRQGPRPMHDEYTYLIGDGEQAVPSCLLPGRDDLCV